MPDPFDANTNKKDMAEQTNMDHVVSKALKQRRRKPAKKTYAKLAMLVPSVAKVLQGSSYGAQAGGFTPSVPTDNSNGITESKTPAPSVKSSEDGWPGIAKAAGCGKKKKGAGYHRAKAVKSSEDHWPGLQKQSLLAGPAISGLAGAGIGGLAGAGVGTLSAEKGDRVAGAGHGAGIGAATGLGAGIGGGVGAMGGNALGSLFGPGGADIGSLLGLLGGMGVGGYGGHAVGNALSEDIAGEGGQPWGQGDDEAAMEEELAAAEGQLPEETTAQPA